MGVEDKMPNPAWINGSICDIEEAMIPLEDRGYFFGDGVYEAIRVYNGRPFYMQAHLDRLQRSAAAIRMELPYTFEEIDSACEKLIQVSGDHEDSYIYMQVTRGSAPRDHAFPADTKPSMSIYVRVIPAPQLKKVSAPAKCITLPDERWLNCYIKTVNLLPNCLARQQAVEAGASEAILYRPGGIITEGTRSNIFAVVDNVVRTHPESNLILSGITRRILLDLMLELQIPFREDALSLDELGKASEVWVTSTISELQPVESVDGKAIGDKVPGEIARKLIPEFKKLTGR